MLYAGSGVYNEEAFAGLDYIIERAGFYGIKLILTFSNEWTTADSKINYLEWGNSTDNSNAFFTDKAIQQFYKDHINTMVNRNVSLPLNPPACILLLFAYSVGLHSIVLLQFHICSCATCTVCISTQFKPCVFTLHVLISVAPHRPPLTSSWPVMFHP